MKWTFKLLPLILITSLTACTKEATREDNFFCFDTVVSLKINAIDDTPLKEIKDICNTIDSYADNYKKRDVIGVYDLNQSNERIEIDSDFYDLLYWSKEAAKVATYFNPLIGSLSKKWKDSLDKNEILSNEIIEQELNKINNSELIIEQVDNSYFAQRIGEAEIDLGAIAKGYALDKCQQYLKDEYSDYIVNAGSSSVLLGSKNSSDHNYRIKIKDLSNPTYFKTYNSIISTSAVSEQNAVIDNVTYSHIVNPITGSATSLYDAVIVINSNDTFGNASLGDALSTSLMMSSLDEIKEIENSFEINVIIIKDNSVLYKSSNISLN